MRVVVAGASGGIGLPVVLLLGKAGHEVTAIYGSPQSRAPIRPLARTSSRLTCFMDSI
jgi:nucleoside-diphosphate-sugar epimerase